jgi:hypothetical protein
MESLRLLERFGGLFGIHGNFPSCEQDISRGGKRAKAPNLRLKKYDWRGNPARLGGPVKKRSCLFGYLNYHALNYRSTGMGARETKSS